jgi:hypothetical protein
VLFSVIPASSSVIPASSSVIPASSSVIPAKAGIQSFGVFLDSRSPSARGQASFAGVTT